MRLKHYLLIGGCCLLTTLCHLSAQSQTEPVRLETVALVELNFPELLYQSTDDGYVPFRIGRNSRGTFNLWLRSERFVAYREVTTPEGETRMEPVLELDVPSGDGDLILFFFHNAAGRVSTRFVEDSPEQHGALQARLINFTGTEVACLIDKQRVILPPGEDETVRLEVAVEERFRFTFQLLDADLMANRSPIKTLRLINPKMRFMAAFTYESRQVDRPGGGTETIYRPEAIRLYDFVGP